MQKRSIFILLFIMACLFVLTPATSQAGSVKERMASRIPVLNGLKDKGSIGENNRGYLEFRSGDKTGGDVVSAENSDRKLVYTEIAKQQGASPDLVGQRRAQMIAEKGQKGHWFQAPDGKWYQK